jgi:hypothetical protein
VDKVSDAAQTDSFDLFFNLWNFDINLKKGAQ